MTLLPINAECAYTRSLNRNFLNLDTVIFKKWIL